jgi:hypothetical protein
VELGTSSLKMYWNTVKQFGGQELWRELLAALRKVGGGGSSPGVGLAGRCMVHAIMLGPWPGCMRLLRCHARHIGPRGAACWAASSRGCRCRGGAQHAGTPGGAIVSVANVAMRWVMQQGGGGAVHPIVGMRSAEHNADNGRVGVLARLPLPLPLPP